MMVFSFDSLRQDKRAAIAATLGVGVLLAIFPFIVGSALGNSWLRVVDFALLYIMLALGLNIVVGFAGQISIGHAAFFGFGAFTSAYV